MFIAGGISIGYDALICGTAELQVPLTQCNRGAIINDRQRLNRGHMNSHGTGNAGTARTVTCFGSHRGNHLTVIAGGSRLHGQPLGFDGGIAHIGPVGQLGHTNTNRCTQGNALGRGRLIGNTGNKFGVDNRLGISTNGRGEDTAIGSIRILGRQDIHSGNHRIRHGGKSQLRTAGTNLISVCICFQRKGNRLTGVGLATEKGGRTIGNVSNSDRNSLLRQNRRHTEVECVAVKRDTVGTVKHIAGITHGDGNGEAPGTVRTLHCVDFILGAVFTLLGGDGNAADLLARLHRGINQADGDGFPGGNFGGGQLDFRRVVRGDGMQLRHKVNDQGDVLCGHHEAPHVVGINLDVHSGGHSLRAGAGGVGVVHAAHDSAIGRSRNHYDLIAGVGLTGCGVLAGSGIGNGAELRSRCRRSHAVAVRSLGDGIGIVLKQSTHMDHGIGCQSFQKGGFEVVIVAIAGQGNCCFDRCFRCRRGGGNLLHVTDVAGNHSCRAGSRRGFLDQAVAEIGSDTEGKHRAAQCAGLAGNCSVSRRVNLHGVADQIFLRHIHRSRGCGRSLLLANRLKQGNDFNQRTSLDGQAGQIDGVGSVGIPGRIAGLRGTVGIQIPNGQAVDQAAGGSFLQPVAGSRGSLQNQLAVFQAALFLNQVHTTVLAGVDPNHIAGNPLRCCLGFTLGSGGGGHRGILLCHRNDGGAVGADVGNHGAVGADVYVAARNHLTGRIDVGFIMICGDAHCQSTVGLDGAGAGVSGRLLRFLSSAGLAGSTLMERGVEGDTAGALGLFRNDKHIFALVIFGYRGRHHCIGSTGIVGCQCALRQLIAGGRIHSDQNLLTRVHLAHIQQKAADAAIVGIGGDGLSGCRAGGRRIDLTIFGVVIPPSDEHVVIRQLVSGLSDVVLGTRLHSGIQIRLSDGGVVLAAFRVIGHAGLEGSVLCQGVGVHQLDGDLHGVRLVGVSRCPVGRCFQRAGDTLVEQVGDTLIGIHLNILSSACVGAFLEGHLNGHIVGRHFKAVGAVRIQRNALTGRTGRQDLQNRIDGCAGFQILHGNAVSYITFVSLDGEGNGVALYIICIGLNRFAFGNSRQHVMAIGKLATLKGVVLCARLEGGIRGQLVSVGSGRCGDRTVGGGGHVDLKLLTTHSLRYMQQLLGDSCLQLGLEGLE